MKKVFGPVPSRRLGRSLGVDLVPYKACSYDCVYCQLGRTTDLTVVPREWFPVEDVLNDVREALSSGPDFITLSGSGEPTLYSKTGELIEGIKAITDVPIAVLTNSSLMWNKAVAEGIMGADLVVPSLDAGNQETFVEINRPHPQIEYGAMLEGLVDFSNRYRGELWLEVFISEGYNSSNREVGMISEVAKRIKARRIQLNTVTRPPAEASAVPVCRVTMQEYAGIFSPVAEVVADYRDAADEGGHSAGRDSVMELLKRRPCTVDDIISGLGIHRNEVVKYVTILEGEGLIEKRLSGGRGYYSVKE